MKIESEGRVGFTATLSMEEIERVFLSEVERRAGATRDEMGDLLRRVPWSPGERLQLARWLRHILGEAK